MRRSWWKNLFTRRGDDSSVEERRDRGLDPAELLDRKERRHQLLELLARLSEKRRTTLALFELEGYSCEEIAELQGISPVTVRTRIHEARRDLFKMVARLPESRKVDVRK